MALRVKKDMFRFPALDKGNILSYWEESWEQKDGRILKACNIELV